MVVEYLITTKTLTTKKLRRNQQQIKIFYVKFQAPFSQKIIKVIYGSMTQGLSVTILRKNNSESTNINFRLNPNAHINSYVINVYKHSQSTMKERHTWD